MKNEYFGIDGYPFEEFTKDYDTISSRVHDQEAGDFMSSMMIVKSYIKDTYSDAADQTGRGAALMMCFTFLSRHIDKLNQGPFAVKGEVLSIYTEPVFRALYEVVAAYAMDNRRSEPKISEVMRRATVYHKEGIE